MAVMRNSITFGGVNSADYGIYIGGEGVFNAPERDVEMVSIPGRNGSFVLDKGRFENITVTYSAFNFEPDLATFKANLDAFRNALCAQEGYQRLTDTFHTDEYRMAAFISGLDIKPIEYNTAAKFDIVFDCKPQRYLTSGETKSSVASGSVITNPTRFESSPLLEFKGYGNIFLHGTPIKMASVPIGNILLSNSATVNIEKSANQINPPPEIARITFDGSKLNAGDAINLAESYVRYTLTYIKQFNYVFDSATIESSTGESWVSTANIMSAKQVCFNTKISAQTYIKGTSSTKTYHYVYRWRRSDGGSYVESGGDSYIKLEYDGDQTIKLYASTFKDDDYGNDIYETVGYLGDVSGYSTVVVDDTFYIDLDIGEAYYIKDGAYSSANYAVTLPAKLPKLKAGSNAITYSNTITDFKVTPRWWKL